MLTETKQKQYKHIQRASHNEAVMIDVIVTSLAGQGHHQLGQSTCLILGLSWYQV